MPLASPAPASFPPSRPRSRRALKKVRLNATLHGEFAERFIAEADRDGNQSAAVCRFIERASEHSVAAARPAMLAQFSALKQLIHDQILLERDPDKRHQLAAFDTMADDLRRRVTQLSSL